MYLQFYDLKRKPFEITTDPKFLWLGEKHKEALATLEYGIREDKGFLLLTGDVGTGKTVLIAGLAQKLDIQSTIATIPDPGLNILDFFNTLADSFNMGRKFKNKGDFLAYLRKFLLKAAADSRKVLLIIDEAQRLNQKLLEEIRLLSNIELHNRKLINIFFVGQPEFNDILMQDRNRAVRHRIAVRYHIEPLIFGEIEKYIQHRLRIAGTKKKIFTKTAIREIFAFSGGNPRLTNIICDHALLSGYSTDMKTISGAIIKECRAELKLPDEEVREKKKKIAMDVAAGDALDEKNAKRGSPATVIAAFIFCAILAVVGGYFLLKPEPEDNQTWSIKDMAPPAPEEAPPIDTDINLNNSEPDTARALPKSSESTGESSDDGDSAMAAGGESAPDLNNRGPDTTGALPKSSESTGEQSDDGDSTMAAGGESAPDLNNRGPDTAGALPKLSESTGEQSDDGDSVAAADGGERALNLAEIQKIVIHFNHNSNELPDKTYQALDRFATALNEDQGFLVDVRGYSDSTGSRSYNISMSEFRANIIKSYLIGKGVSPSRISTSGLGPDDPIASNETKEGRWQNRRVEIHFIAINSTTGQGN